MEELLPTGYLVLIKYGPSVCKNISRAYVAWGYIRFGKETCKTVTTFKKFFSNTYQWYFNKPNIKEGWCYLSSREVFYDKSLSEKNDWVMVGFRYDRELDNDLKDRKSGSRGYTI